MDVALIYKKKKGGINYNMPSGIYKKSEEHKKKLGISLKNNKNALGHKFINYQKNIEVMRKINLGNKYTLGYKQKPEIKKIIGRASKERWKDRNYKKKVSKKISNIIKKKWANDINYRNNSIKGIARFLNHTKNKSEAKLEQILEKLFPKTYKYVGDGKIFIGCKVPDFIHLKRIKKLIELFGEAWHSKKDELSRINHFKKYGYQTLIVWVKELDAPLRLKKKLIKFEGGL